MKVLIDTSPLKNENAIRGVGVYTKFLTEQFAQKNFSDIHLVSNASDNPDLIHYPYFDLFFPTLPILLSSPFKRVVTIHDVIPLLFPDHYKPGLKGTLNHFRQKSALRFIDAVITDSEASKRDIEKYLGISSEKIHVVYLAGNPKITEVSTAKQQEVKTKYGLPQKYILYVGDINFNKNVPELISALKFLPEELSLVCVGKNFKPQDIPEWHAIESMVQTVLGRTTFITDLGSDATSDLSAIYSGATAYVQPSLAEGFGLPVLEAMQTKTLVVSAQNSSLIEVGGSCVKYVDTTAESIAEGVQKVLKLSQTEKKQLTEKAHLWSKQFSWQKTAEKTMTVYKKVLNLS